MLCNNYFVSNEVLYNLFVLQQLHLLQTPPPLCDFEQWIDTEIKSEDKEWMQKLLRWEAEDKEMMEKRRREEALEKEHKEEEACCFAQGGEGEEA